jgi:putative hydrolase of HD superfamily
MSDLKKFLTKTYRLKQMTRNGWLFSGISKAEVESVADHSFFTALLALLLGLQAKEKKHEINLEKILIMALIHDLSEALSQDIDRRVRKYAPQKYDEFKKELDKNAMKELVDSLPKYLGKVFWSHFQEYQEQRSEEAKITREADRLETMLQLEYYLSKGYPKKLFQEFFDNFKIEKQDFSEETVKELITDILKEEEES